MKKAIIVGCKGQDGQLLNDTLYSKNYQILGLDIEYVQSNFKNNYLSIDITNKEEVDFIIKTFKPDEIYYLAAFHHSSQDLPDSDYQLYIKSYSINLFGLINFLEAIKLHSPYSKLFYASSSLIFENTTSQLQTEDTYFSPNSIYGFTKLDGLYACRYYRDKYNIFASVGILYNHESHLREDKYLSKKIVLSALKIANKQQTQLILGNLDAEIDWGYAPDYVEAMHKILLLETPDDFIISTGIKHSIKEFVHIAFSYLGLKWQDYVSTDKTLLNRNRNVLIGDASKLRTKANWLPSVTFEEMIKLIINKIRSSNE